MNSITRVLAVLVFAGWSSSVAATPILTFTDGFSEGPIGDTVGGWEFEVFSSIVVDGLGFWDDDSDGLDRNHDVGLWTLAGDLLATTTITNAAAPETNGAGPGWWLFSDIGQLVLGSGSYILGATFIDQDSDHAGIDVSSTTITGVNFVMGRQASGSSSLIFPGDPVPDGVGVFGPNLRLASDSVPAPATVVLFGLGLAGLGWTRRKRA
jgi:hypothetical protein